MPRCARNSGTDTRNTTRAPSGKPQAGRERAGGIPRVCRLFAGSARRKRQTFSPVTVLQSIHGSRKCQKIARPCGGLILLPARSCGRRVPVTVSIGGFCIALLRSFMNCSHVDMCTPHAMWGPERAITPSISRDLMEEDVPVLCESTVREPSDHGLIHTGEKARPSRTPQILIYRDET